MLLNVINSKKYCHKSIRIGISNTFWTKYCYCNWWYFSQVLLTSLVTPCSW